MSLWSDAAETHPLKNKSYGIDYIIAFRIKNKNSPNGNNTMIYFWFIGLIHMWSNVVEGDLRLYHADRFGQVQSCHIKSSSGCIKWQMLSYDLLSGQCVKPRNLSNPDGNVVKNKKIYIFFD